MKKPKVLIYDIETTPLVSYTWGIYQQDVIKVKKHWQILCIAWKWAGEKKVHFMKAGRSDLAICKKLHSLFKKADILVAHNGDAFDYKKSCARMAYHNLPPVPSPASVDTYKVAKRHFAFTSNRLGDLGEHLGLGKKVPTPGISLWEGCMAGEKKSWALMEKYNRQDVNLLEKVYQRFLPWISSHPNLALLRHGKEGTRGCPNCGENAGQKNGVRVTARSRKQRWRCTSCGSCYETGIGKQ